MSTINSTSILPTKLQGQTDLISLASEFLNYFNAYFTGVFMILAIFNNIFIILILLLGRKEMNKGISASVQYYYLFLAIAAIYSLLPNQISDWLGTSNNNLICKTTIALCT